VPRAATVADGRAGLLALNGADLGYSSWHTLDQAQVDTFADLTGDHQWMHVDPVRAAAGPFGGTIVHGFLTLALVPLFLQELLSVTGVSLIVNYGLDRVRFPSPVLVGSPLRARLFVDDVTDFGDSLQLTVAITVEVSGGKKPVCVARMLSRYWT
jgi:acyl dehydratase